MGNKHVIHAESSRVNANIALDVLRYDLVCRITSSKKYIYISKTSISLIKCVV